MLTQKDISFFKKFKTWCDPKVIPHGYKKSRKIYPQIFEISKSGQILISYRKNQRNTFCCVEGWMSDPKGTLSGHYSTPHALLNRLKRITPNEDDDIWDHDLLKENLRSNAMARFAINTALCSFYSTFKNGVIFRFPITSDLSNARIIMEDEVIESIGNTCGQKDVECVIRSWLWKKLPKADYWVTVLENGFHIFEQTEGDFIVYVKTEMKTLNSIHLSQLPKQPKVPSSPSLTSTPITDFFVNGEALLDTD
jgi:hypothetical protein